MTPPWGRKHTQVLPRQHVSYPRAVLCSLLPARRYFSPLAFYASFDFAKRPDADLCAARDYRVPRIRQSLHAAVTGAAANLCGRGLSLIPCRRGGTPAKNVSPRARLRCDAHGRLIRRRAITRFITHRRCVSRLFRLFQRNVAPFANIIYEGWEGKQRARARAHLNASFGASSVVRNHGSSVMITRSSANLVRQSSYNY